MTRPTIQPEWATDTNFTNGSMPGTPTKVDPGAGVRAEGVLPDRVFPAAHMNHQLASMADWIAYYKNQDWLSFNFFDVGYSGDLGYLGSNLNGGALMNLAERSIETFPPADQRMAGVTLNGEFVHSQDGFKWTALSAGTLDPTQLPKAIHWCEFVGVWIILGVQASAIEIATAGPITAALSSHNDPGTDFDRNAVADNGTDLIVIVRGDEGLLTSGDASTWTERTNPATDKDMRGVVYGDGLWVAVGALGTIISSVNGTVWTDRTAGAAAVIGGVDLVDIAYDPVHALFVAVSSSDDVGPFTSADGITWVDNAFTVPAGSGTNKIISDGAGALYISGNTYVARSIDGGTTWEGQLIEAMLTVKGISIAGGRLIVYGESHQASAVGPNDPFGIGVGPRVAL